MAFLHVRMSEFLQGFSYKAEGFARIRCIKYTARYWIIYHPVLTSENLGADGVLWKNGVQCSQDLLKEKNPNVADLITRSPQNDGITPCPSVHLSSYKQG